MFIIIYKNNLKLIDITSLVKKKNNKFIYN